MEAPRRAEEAVRPAPNGVGRTESKTERWWGSDSSTLKITRAHRGAGLNIMRICLEFRLLNFRLQAGGVRTRDTAHVAQSESFKPAGQSGAAARLLRVQMVVLLPGTVFKSEGSCEGSRVGTPTPCRGRGWGGGVGVKALPVPQPGQCLGRPARSCRPDVRSLQPSYPSAPRLQTRKLRPRRNNALSLSLYSLAGVGAIGEPAEPWRRPGRKRGALP